MKFILKRATMLTIIVTLLFILIGCSNSPTKDIPVTGISLDQTMVSLNIGESVKLKATILPQNATNQNLIWTSSNEEIFSVSDDGLVTALDYGTAVISVSTVENEIASSCNFRIQGDWVKGELFARLYAGSDKDWIINDLEEQFSDYELKVISLVYRGHTSVHYSHLSYNSDLVDEFEMLEKIRNAHHYTPHGRYWKIDWVGFERGWILGEINIVTQSHIFEFDDESFSKFLLSFSKYDLRLIFVDRSLTLTTKYRLSFNHDLIDEFEFFEELRYDSKLCVEFTPELPNWKQGEVRVSFWSHYSEDEVDKFLLRFSEYEVKILDPSYVPEGYEYTCVLISFNHLLICEYEFIELLRSDPIVAVAGIWLPIL
ncbi:MAG: Ig-like domain-containing protein [Candidatus Cloacimonetes bacterium]|nr:Ig-like domain-containing protein [Candidatus Cloacimonadota bacterium]